MNDVTRKAPKAEGQATREEKKRADGRDDQAENQQHATEIAKGIHEKSLENRSCKAKRLEVRNTGDKLTGMHAL